MRNAKEEKLELVLSSFGSALPVYLKCLQLLLVMCGICSRARMRTKKRFGSSILRRAFATTIER